MEKTYETFTQAVYDLLDHNIVNNDEKFYVTELPKGWYLSTLGDDLFSDEGITIAVFDENDDIDSQYEIGFFTLADLLSTNWVDDIAGRLYNNYHNYNPNI